VKVVCVAIAVSVVLSGCSSATKIYPSTGSLVPNTSFQLTPNLNVALEKIVYWGAYAGVAYLVLDPLAPNWQIEEARFSATQYHLALHMKRYYAGGAGEARVVFNRRAKDLVRSLGAESYRILEYSEGMESSLLGSRRVGEGVLELVALKPPEQEPAAAKVDTTPRPSAERGEAP
jgi:uncharacterized protein YceK